MVRGALEALAAAVKKRRAAAADHVMEQAASELRDSAFVLCDDGSLCCARHVSLTLYETQSYVRRPVTLTPNT